MAASVKFFENFGSPFVLFADRPGQAAYVLAGPDVVFRKPSAWHFEGEGDLREAARHGLLVVGLEVVEFHDGSIGCDVCDGERDFGVPHPEGNRAGLRHDEKHAGIGCEFFSEHEARRALVFFIGDFGTDCFAADSEVGDRQFRLGLRLRGTSDGA